MVIISEKNYIAVKTETFDPGLHDSMTKKVLRGGAWIFALRMINRGAGFVRTIILARLLSPTDFGLFGIALLSISALETFSQTGFQAALVQKKGDVESFLDTAWTIAVVRGFLIFFVLFFFAPLIADFFNSPQAIPIIKAIAISVILSGLKNIKLIFYQKELQFKKQFLYEFSSTLVHIVVVIVGALILKNAWALVLGLIASNIVRVGLSYIIYPYNPKIKLEKKKFSTLFRFGKWVWGSTALIFCINQGDDIFLGKVLGVTALGFYQMAYILSNLSATEITKVISTVTFPAYAKLQSDVSRLGDAYLKVLKITAFITIPLAGGIFIFSPEFIKFFLGEKWKGIVPVIQVLVFTGLLRSLAAATGPIFHGLGLPHIDTSNQFIRLIILAIFIYPLTVKWGMVGTSISVLVSTFVGAIFFLLKSLKITKVEYIKFIRVICIPSINTIFTVLIILIGKYYVELENIMLLIEFILVYCALYIIFTYISEKYLNYELLNILKSGWA